MVMTIPEQHYVGYKNQQGTHFVGRLPLGFATPYGTDAAARKRMTTVDNWAHPGYGSKAKGIESKVLDNKLNEGFKLCEEVRRNSGWGNGTVVWRIEDPRGFELEISSANFASIVACTTIINGEIQGRCVWGRDGGTNVLLPEASGPYQEAAHLTKLSKQKVSIKDVQPGDKVRLKDGREVIFLGTYTFLVYGTDKRYEGRYGYSRTGSGYKHIHQIGGQKKRQMYVEFKDAVAVQGVELTTILHRQRKRSDDYIYFQGGPESAADMKIAEVIERQALAIDTNDVCKHINALDANARNGYAGVDDVLHVTTGSYGKEIEAELVKIELAKVPYGRTVFTKSPLGVVHALSVHIRSKKYAGRDVLVDITEALAEVGKAAPGVDDQYTDVFSTLGWPVFEMKLKTAQGVIPVDMVNFY